MLFFYCVSRRKKEKGSIENGASVECRFLRLTLLLPTARVLAVATRTERRFKSHFGSWYRRPFRSSTPENALCACQRPQHAAAACESDAQQEYRNFSATRPCGSKGTGGGDATMQRRASSSGCTSGPATGEPARAGRPPRTTGSQVPGTLAGRGASATCTRRPGQRASASHGGASPHASLPPPPCGGGGDGAFRGRFLVSISPIGTSVRSIISPLAPLHDLSGGL
jgi:hypothetical protein